ncbi:MAG: PQQ-binding-like beta-propeller repeat protein [Acidobacteria bacterium]|nr:PQQ-binding-like beta-propeller repeat protein [Acidobacteriota bacterium]
MTSPATLRVVTVFVLLTGLVSAQDWPSFRGPSGGHSSPVVWGTRIFLTTALANDASAHALTLGDLDRAGIDPAKDLAPHQWQVLAVDRDSGKMLWTRTVHQGVPRVKRHVKASHASATPATNGRVLVAMLGSEGLFAFDMNGAELWRKDLGPLRVGLADEPEYEWGPASSPVIAGDVVLVQNDRYKDSFLAAYDLLTGKELWRSGREERPSWTTPLVHTHQNPTAVVAVSPFFARGHDLATGRELWRVADPEGQVKASTPVAAGELTIVTGGWPSAARPIVAVRVRDGSVNWRHDMNDVCMATPALSGDLLLVRTKSHLYALRDRN